MSIEQEIVKLITNLNNKFENKVANKKTDITGDYTRDTISYPTVQAVKNYISNLLNNKADKSDIPTKTSDLTNDSGFLTEHQSLDSKTIDFEKLATPNAGFSASYIIKQNNVQVGPALNIPKDFLVRSASSAVVTEADKPVEGYKVGDTYLDFVVNTVDDDETPKHIYLNATAFVHTYTADESTLTLDGNVFSIKNGGVTLVKLASSVQTSLGYADAWNNSPAKNITAQNINDWNAKSDLTMDDVDARIEEVLDAISTGISE